MTTLKLIIVLWEKKTVHILKSFSLEMFIKTAISWANVNDLLASLAGF